MLVAYFVIGEKVIDYLDVALITIQKLTRVLRVFGDIETHCAMRLSDFADIKINGSGHDSPLGAS